MKVARSSLPKQNAAPLVMNSSEAQPDSESRLTYVDAEQADLSGQQFAVSLEQDGSQPPFVVESNDSRESELSQENVPEDTRHISESESAVSEPNIPRPRSDADPTTEGREAELQPAPRASAPDWRDLVSAKVSSYKSRRPRKDRYPSLQLQFEKDSRRQRPPKEDFTFENSEQPESSRNPEPPSRNSVLPPPVLMESTARVLEFRRPAAPPVRTDELADPVVDRPRIVEAPELLPPPPAMGGILIEAAPEPEPERRRGFDVPLQSATLKRRLLGGGIDLILVAAAAALFAYLVLRIVGPGLSLRGVIEVSTGVLAVFWPAYQYAFLVFCGRTPGLPLAGLEVLTFDGAPVTRVLRRWRVLASMLSVASLGLGYLWCFLDEDQLTWHDRITRTHLAPAIPTSKPL